MDVHPINIDTNRFWPIPTFWTIKVHVLDFYALVCNNDNLWPLPLGSMLNKIKDFTCNIVDVSISKGVKPFKLELDTKGPIKTMNIFLSGADKFRTIPKWVGNDIPSLILHMSTCPNNGNVSEWLQQSPGEPLQNVIPASQDSGSEHWALGIITFIPSGDDFHFLVNK